MDMYNRVEGTGPLSARVATGFEAERENGRRVLTESVLQGISARCSRRLRSVLFQISTSSPRKSSKTASGGGHGGRRMTEASTRARTPAMDGTASPNIHTIVKAQIVFLLSTLTEDNFERNQVEIRSVRDTRAGFILASRSLQSKSACLAYSCPSSMASTRTSTSSAVSLYTPTADSRPPLLLPHLTHLLPSHSASSSKRHNASHAILSSQTGSEMVSIGAKGMSSGTSISSSSRTG